MLCLRRPLETRRSAVIYFRSVRCASLGAYFLSGALGLGKRSGRDEGEGQPSGAFFLCGASATSFCQLPSRLAPAGGCRGDFAVLRCPI